MHYLVVEGSSPESLPESCSETTQGKFTVAYSDDVEIKQEENTAFLFQGMISNKEELRENFPAETEGNVELFQKCYEKGSKVLDSIEGLYTAIIVRDSNVEVFRDVFGSKPVYYSQRNDSLVLSSNISPILRMEPECLQLNEQAAADYLANGLIDHRRETFFQGIERLRPREELVYNNTEINLEKVDYPSTDNPRKLKKLVEENIERLKPESEDYYCPVSGGLDSAITASKCRDAKHIHVSFGRGTKDEDYLPSVRSEYELDIQKVDVKPVDLLEEVKNTVKVQEEPTAFPAVPAQSILYDRIENGKTVITGTGADELFFGYSWFLPFYLAERLREKGPISFFRGLIEYRKSMSLSHVRGIVDILLNGATSIPVNTDKFVEVESNPLQTGALEEAKRKHLDSFYFPHILRSVEKNSQYHHLDVRPAFLSKELLTYSWCSEPSECFQYGLNKYLLRSEFREELPEKIYSRKQKTGFVSSSSNLYTKESTEELIEVLESESFRNRELINSRKVVRSLKKGSLPFEVAYRFYNYELWMQEFLD